MTLALVKPKPKLISSMAYFARHGVDVVGVAPLDIVDVSGAIAKLSALFERGIHQRLPLIITSTEAASRMIKAWPKDAEKGQLAYCVGESTAALLTPYFQRCVVPTVQSSEGLIFELEKSSCSGSDFILVKGEGGRAVINEFLEQQGTHVEEIALYRRQVLSVPYVPTYFMWKNVDIIMVTSAELLQALLTAYPNDNLIAKRWIVPSERVRDVALAMGCEEIITSNGATNAHLLGCVKLQPRGRT